jgi:perosamine synthetase
VVHADEESITMRVAVIGAGKMGLPLACQFATGGATVVAADLRASVVDAINAGISPIDEPGVPELLASAVQSGRLRATTDTCSAVADSEVVVVIVPALLTSDRHADLSALKAVSEQIARRLKPGMMISYETTVPIGATRSHLLPVLEDSGLTAGIDFDLVYSPERVKSQSVLKHLTQTPKVVGGITREAAKRGADFYNAYLGTSVINVETLEAAEMVKLAGMVYRDVNIALANELARYAEKLGVELAPVIEAANTDGEAQLLRPGIGVGGHCTPVYPYFLIREGERVGVPMTLAERSRRINDGQAAHTVSRILRALQSLSASRVLILGLAFRPSVKEHILSPAFLLQSELSKLGAEVYLHDPLYSEAELRHHGFTPGSLEAHPAPEVIILNTAHPEYRNLDFALLAERGTKIVVDGRGLWSADKVRAAGLAYIGIGQPEECGSAQQPSLPIAKPVLGGEEAEAASEVIRSGWVLQGPQVAAFEREFAAYTKAQHACAVSSGTTALHLALLAAGVRSGDEVITVSHSYIATANSVRYCGATPVFVDIQPGTFNMDPGLIERVITERTRAILCVHQIGMPCDLTKIVKIAKRHGLPVIEDAACAIGSEILWNDAWERIGKPQSDIACFSFHPRKLLTTGDGGMITTSNPEWDKKFRLWRQHSMSIPDNVCRGAREVVFESYPMLGYNYRMTDIQAAVGREQLKRLPAMIEKRRFLAKRYGELLSGITGVMLPEEPVWARSNWQSYCLRLPEWCDQREVMQKLLDVGVATRSGIMCAHHEPAYIHEPWSCGEEPNRCGCSRGSCARLRESERAHKQAIILPLFHEMTEADQIRVVNALHHACAHENKAG